MPLTVGLRWLLDDAEIDARLIALLHSISERGSLKQAVGHVGVSYRHAWEQLSRLEEAFGQKLVQLERGRGARLTPAGEQLVSSTTKVEERLQAQLKAAAADLNRPLARTSALPDVPLRMHASHDLALNKLAEGLANRGVARIDLHVQGSLDALVSLSRNRCDVAGFHVPKLPGRQSVLEEYRPWLRNRTLRLVHFADRTQGLIVARNNPFGIKSLADVARSKARFVNRQPGSGTRIFFDALLSAHRLRPAQIQGYRHEEFTHAAVAAMIASGAADVGFGIEAAAAQQALSFVPLATERYFLAMRATTPSRPAAKSLLAALESRWFRKIVRDMPGYVLPERPVLMSAHEIFEQKHS
jgi:molybdate transport repressor ModE-like protein